MTRLSDERKCRGRELQLLVKDTQKAREAKDDLTQEGTATSKPSCLDVGRRNTV